MSKPLVFLSYRHDDPWSGMAKRLYMKLLPPSRNLGFELYVDQTMRSGERWEAELSQLLDRTTHLVVFLCDDYWASEECKKELDRVLERYDAWTGPESERPRLLFALAGEVNPKYLRFDRERGQGDVSIDDKPIGGVSDVHFLGPFSQHGRLEILDRADAGRLDLQLGQLRERLLQTLPATRTTT